MSCQVAEVAQITTAKQPKLWMIISNNVTYKPDTLDLFNSPEKWKNGLELLDVFMFNTPTSKDPVGEPNFLRTKVIPLLKQHDIAIAYDTGVPTWYSCRSKGARANNLQYDLDFFERVKNSGGSVSYVRFQSSLGKKPPENLLANCQNYDYAKRIDDLVFYAKAVHEKYPEIKFSLADATDAFNLKGDDYRPVFRKLVEDFKKNGLQLDSIVLDTSYEISSEKRLPGVFPYSEMLKMQNFVQNVLGIEFGLIPISYNQDDLVASAQAFHGLAIEQVTNFLNVGGSPDFYIVGSWLNYPKTFLPENDNVNYPLTRLLLQLGRMVKNVEGELPKSPTADFKLKGAVSQSNFDNNTLLGWAFNESNPRESLDVSVYMDGPKGSGVLIANGTTNILRDDVNAQFSISGDHGFKIKIPAEFYDNRSHSFYLYASDRDNESDTYLIRNSPVNFVLRR
jgi:hypothetical protein